MSNKVETESELDTLKKENLELKDRVSHLNREIKAMKEEMIRVRSNYYSQQPKTHPLTGLPINNSL
jgi:cell division protein FtsB